LFECLLWLEFKDVFYLFGPHNNTALEDVGLVLFRDLLTLGKLVWWSGELCLASDLAHCYIGLCQVVIELLNKVFRDQFSPLLRVLLVVEQGHENMLEHSMHVCEGVPS